MGMFDFLDSNNPDNLPGLSMAASMLSGGGLGGGLHALIQQRLMSQQQQTRDKLGQSLMQFGMPQAQPQAPPVANQMQAFDPSMAQGYAPPPPNTDALRTMLMQAVSKGVDPSPYLDIITKLAPKQMTPYETAQLTRNSANDQTKKTEADYATLDAGSNDIAKAMAPSDLSLGSSAPGLSWLQRQKAFADEQLKKNNPNQPFNDDGTPNKAYQDYKLKEVGAEAAARSAATNGTGLGADGKAIGTLGSPTINATAPGYSSAVVPGTGITQASIDQKAINYITSGTLPPQGRTGMAGTQNAAISNRMAELAPAGNLAVNKTKLKSYSESLSQQQKYLDTTQRALNTANDTLDSLQTWMEQNGVNPNQFPDVNIWNNWLKAKGIDPGTAGGYNAQLATLRAEYSQVLAKGGVRSVETDREAAKLIPDGLAPADLKKVADRIKVDADNVVRDSQKQVAQITGQLNGALSGHDAQTAASTNGPPRIKDAADYAKLPPGPYIDPNGVARVKK